MITVTEWIRKQYDRDYPGRPYRLASFLARCRISKKVHPRIHAAYFKQKYFKKPLQIGKGKVKCNRRYFEYWATHSRT